jgi:hypothetical protein
MNKKLALQAVIIIVGTAFMTGCAPMISGAMNLAVDENSVLEKTASYFDVARENIKISSIEKGGLSTSYKANYAGKAYNCSIYYGEVKCNQSGVANGVNAQTGAGNRPATTLPVSETPEVNKNHAMSAVQAQARLNQLGYQVGVPDGVLGKRTVEKLKIFQKSSGLTVSGKLDAPTIEALQ